MLILAGKVAGGGIKVVLVGLGLSLLGGCLHGGLPGRPQDVGRTVKLKISDHSFGAKSIPVKDGETVRFLVRNAGRRHHDFAIGTPYKQKLRRYHLQGRFGAGEPDANPRSHDAYNAVALPPGSTRELIWWFSRARNLEFACNMPGHYERGMKGTFDFHGNTNKPRTSQSPRKKKVAAAPPRRKPAPKPPAPDPRPDAGDQPAANKPPTATPIEQSPLFSAP